MKQVNGDLLLAKEKYIAHQCNCCTTDPKGLSLYLFKKYPYANTYKKRVKNDKSTYSEPGTIDVCCTNNGDNKCIINMYAQVYPSTGKYSNDSKEKRISWFKECLNQIKKIDGIQNESVAMPYNIGCGLAGGDWPTYEKILKEFVDNEKINIVLYKID